MNINATARPIVTGHEGTCSHATCEKFPVAIRLTQSGFEVAYCMEHYRQAAAFFGLGPAAPRELRR